MERLRSIDRDGNILAAKDNIKKTTTNAAFKQTGTTSSSEQSSSHPLKTGDVIRHVRFGRGVVQYTKGEGKKFQVRVRFDSGRHATLMVAQGAYRNHQALTRASRIVPIFNLLFFFSDSRLVCGQCLR